MLTRSFARSDLGGHAAPTAEALPASLADRSSVSGEPPQLVVGFEFDMVVIAGSVVFGRHDLGQLRLIYSANPAHILSERGPAFGDRVKR